MSAQTAVVYFKNSLSSYDAEASNEFSSVGLDASGNYAIVTDANYIQSADKITSAIEALDDAIHQISVDYTTIEDMDARITNLVNSAPGTLDTLKEIADSLGNDANFTASLVNSITARRDAAKAAELTENVVECHSKYRSGVLQSER